MKVSAKEKRWIDIACGLVGTVAGYLVTHGVIGTSIGLAVGYLASDIMSEVDTGSSPSVATIASQVASVQSAS